MAVLHLGLPGAGVSPISIIPQRVAVQEQPMAPVCQAEYREQLEPALFYELCKALVGAGSLSAPPLPLQPHLPLLPQPGTQPWPLAPGLCTAGQYFWAA